MSNKFSKIAKKIFAKLEKSTTAESLENVCASMNVELPKRFAKYGKKKVTKVTFGEKYIIPGSVYFMIGSSSRYQRLLDSALEKGVLVVFADKERFSQTKINENDYPVVLLDNAVEHVANYYKASRDAYEGTVIAITGSLGKTTTRQYIDCVLGDASKFVSIENLNSTNIVAGNTLTKMNNNLEYFLQEVGAGGVDTVAVSAAILKPEISIVTNVKAHHLSAYGNIEKVFADKIKLVENVREGGVAIVNFDDERLAEFDYKCKRIAIGIDTDREVEYKGENIIQNEDILSMDIIHNGITTHIESVIYGKHNAYNILTAFALGKYLGMADEELAKKIGNYRTEGIRQNLKVHGSNTFLMDCYNVSNDSIINSVKTLQDYPLPEGARRIAVIGGENKLGKKRLQLTRELGEALKDYEVSEIICFGTEDRDKVSLNKYGDALTLSRALKKNGVKNVKLITSFDKLCDYLKETVKPGDAVLCKCIYWLNAAVAIDKVFGSVFSVDLKYIKDLSDTCENNKYEFRKLLNMGQLQITGTKSKGSINHVEIPDGYKDMELFGIDDELFKENIEIKSVDFGSTLKVIGRNCFEGCTGITEIELPDSIVTVMDSAFEGCTSLKKVKFGKSVKHIGRNAFAGCTNLEEVYIPETVQKIENNAFEDKIIVKYY